MYRQSCRCVAELSDWPPAEQFPTCSCKAESSRWKPSFLDETSEMCCLMEPWGRCSATMVQSSSRTTAAPTRCVQVFIVSLWGRKRLLSTSLSFLKFFL